MPKKLSPEERAEKDYLETLQMLAEGRAAANRLREEAGWRDDSSPFNPRLSSEEAYQIIKKAAKNAKKEDPNP